MPAESHLPGPLIPVSQSQSSLHCSRQQTLVSPQMAPERPGSSACPVRIGHVHSWQKYKQMSTTSEPWAPLPEPCIALGHANYRLTTNHTKADSPFHSPARGTKFPQTREHYKSSFSTIQMVLVSPLPNKSLLNQQNSSNLSFFFLLTEEKKIPTRTLLLLREE